MENIKEKAFRSLIADLILDISYEYGTNMEETAKLINLSTEDMFKIMKEEIPINSDIIFNILEMLNMDLILKRNEKEKDKESIKSPKSLIKTFLSEDKNLIKLFKRLM